MDDVVRGHAKLIERIAKAYAPKCGYSWEDMYQDLWLRWLDTPDRADEETMKQILTKEAKRIRREIYNDVYHNKALKKRLNGQWVKRGKKQKPNFYSLLANKKDKVRWQNVMEHWDEYVKVLSRENKRIVNYLRRGKTQVYISNKIGISRQATKKRIEKIMEGFKIYYETR